MSRLWRYLFRDNPMQIETLRAVRRFTVTSGDAPNTQRYVTRTLYTVLGALYLWFLITILVYHEDISQGILWFELGLLTLLVPGSLYAAISGERERLTWDSLILTNLSPGRILAGKLLWRLGLVGAIMLLFVPPLLLTHYATHYARSYSLSGLFWIQINIAAWCVFLATFTLWVSARTKRSVVTLSIVTVFLLAFLGLTPGLMMIFSNWTKNPVEAWTLSYWMRNPVGAWPLSSASPMSFLGFLLQTVNPATVVQTTEPVAHNTWNDMWGSFLEMIAVLYLFLAGLCMGATLRALARLGLPIQKAKE